MFSIDTFLKMALENGSNFVQKIRKTYSKYSKNLKQKLLKFQILTTDFENFHPEIPKFSTGCIGVRLLKVLEVEIQSSRLKIEFVAIYAFSGTVSVKHY